MRRWAAATLLTMVPCFLQAGGAEELLSGYLCCNLFTDGFYISDMSIGGPGEHIVPLGSPIRITGYSKYKLKVLVENKKQDLGNDYSRDMPMSLFARRFIVNDDPTVKLKSFPKNIQSAIADGHVVRGMTREQVIMSLGYPATSEIPNLSSNAWTYWYTDKVQYRVTFDANDHLSDVENVVDVKSKLLAE
jgi:hypothetical protein